MARSAGAQDGFEREAGAEKYRPNEARRDDLHYAFGVIVAPPFHGQDETGEWHYGLVPRYGMADPDLTAAFELEMRSIVASELSPVVRAGILNQSEIGAIQGRHYEAGPAAQSWPSFLYTLYQDAQPFINDGASLLAWGTAILAILRRMSEWRNRLRVHPDSKLPTGMMQALTMPAVASIVYADLVERYGIGEVVKLDILPRSDGVFVSVGHPYGHGWMTYLIRAKAGKRSFFYFVDSSGSVIEHFLVAADEVTLLPMPDRHDIGAPQNLVPQRAYQFVVDGQ